MKPNRSLFLILFLGANILFLAACALTGAVPAAQNSAPVAQTTAAPQSAQSDQATATNAPAAAAATATQPAAPAQAVPVLSADEVYKTVQTAWAKLEKAGPRHISQSFYQGSNVMNTEADSVPPNYHMVTSVNGTVMGEQYFYNGTLYGYAINHPEWTKVDLAGAFKSTLAGFAEGLADQIVLADGKVVGIEAINSKAATEYSYTSALKGLSAKPVTHTVWIDNASGLPVKQEILQPTGEKTVQLITYDASIQITLSDAAKNAKSAK